MEQDEKVSNLEAKITTLEESVKALMNLNLNQTQTIIFKLEAMEKSLNNLLYKQI